MLIRSFAHEANRGGTYLGAPSRELYLVLRDLSNRFETTQAHLLSTIALRDEIFSQSSCVRRPQFSPSSIELGSIDVLSPMIIEMTRTCCCSPHDELRHFLD